MKWFFSPPFLSVSPFLLLNFARRQSCAYVIGLYTSPEIKSWPDVKFFAHVQCVLLRCCIWQASLSLPVLSPFSHSFRDSEAAEEARVERCVVDIERWMTSNKLKLNENKRKLLVISSKYRSGPMVTSIQVGFETVRHEPFIRNLGVIQLDQDIAWYSNG